MTSRYASGYASFPNYFLDSFPIYDMILKMEKGIIMKDIRVVPDGRNFKVMVNFIQRAIYQSPLMANKCACEIKQKEFTSYNLTLIQA